LRGGLQLAPRLLVRGKLVLQSGDGERPLLLRLVRRLVGPVGVAVAARGRGPWPGARDRPAADRHGARKADAAAVQAAIPL
jgi:hypothetical protein